MTKLRTTSLDTVAPRSVDWLWPGRVPLGAMSILAGEAGLGKSMLVSELVAAVSAGRQLGSGPPLRQGSVLMANAEDDVAAVQVPRLIAAGADLSRVRIIDGVVRRTDRERVDPWTLADRDALIETARGIEDLRLIVIDPIGSFLGGRTDAHRDNEVRSMLGPLASIAAERGLAVLLVAHVRKSQSDRADDAVLGSRAFTAACRSALHVVRDPENRDRRLLLPGKSNLGRRAKGLAFTIEIDTAWPHTFEDPGRVIWHGEVEHDADELASARMTRNRPAPAVDAAINFIRRQLAGGPREAVEVQEAATAAGHSAAAIKRARAALEVVAEKGTFGGGWHWTLPGEGDQLAPKAQVMNPLGISTHKREGAQIRGPFRFERIARSEPLRGRSGRVI